MRKQLEIQIKPQASFTDKKSIHNDIELHTIEMALSRPNIEKLRGYKWDMLPNIIVDRTAVVNDHYLSLLMELIEIVSIGYGYRQINTKVVNVSKLEKIICNNYPTVETYFEQLPLLEKVETNYWYLTSSKDGIKVGIDEYEYALRKYTGDNDWHVSGITEHDKQHVVYEFTNTYDDFYY